MSNPKLAFADDIKRLFAMFPGIVAYADEVGKTGSLEQAAKEAEESIGKAKAAFETQASALEKKRQEHLQSVQNALNNAEEAKLKVKDIIADANVRADKILVDARVKAQSIVAEAHTENNMQQKRVEGYRIEIQHYQNDLNKIKSEWAEAADGYGKAVAKKKQIEDEIRALKDRL